MNRTKNVYKSLDSADCSRERAFKIPLFSRDGFVESLLHNRYAQDKNSVLRVLKNALFILNITILGMEEEYLVSLILSSI